MRQKRCHHHPPASPAKAGPCPGWMGMATEPGAHEPGQIFLRRSSCAAGWEFEGSFGIGTGGCHIQGVHGEIAAPGLGASAAHGDVPILSRLCPEAEEATKAPISRLCPAAGRCSLGSPCLPQPSSWPWLPGPAGHAPVPPSPAKAALGSCPVPRCFAGSVMAAAGAEPCPRCSPCAASQDGAGLTRCRNPGPCCRRGRAVDFRSVAVFSWQLSWAGAAWEPGSAWSRGRGRSSSLLLRNPPPTSCSTGRAPASPS